MNTTEYSLLLNKPDAINERHTASLERIMEEFPYFQSARALRLKGLYNQDSFKYNNALKVTAAHTTDRSVLFDFITSDTFTAIQKGLYDQKLEQLYDIEVKGSEIIIEKAPAQIPLDTREQSIRNLIPDVAVAENPAEAIATPLENESSAVEASAQKLELGRPLEFSREEKHSFQEWLQLSALKPIERETTEPEPVQQQEVGAKQKKSQLIDKFIEANPKIPPVKPDGPTVTFESAKGDNTYLMTETLARVYLEQKKYQKAIQAYEILILKNPEKSSFFADRISDIKNIQQNNNK
ncbi:MAG TPA: hypothetical protein VF581_03555 [Flavobacterium sp.]|jgi:tetratricopeptide (TPR) repeat protein